jgi:hypothetical protein
MCLSTQGAVEETQFGSVEMDSPEGAVALVVIEPMSPYLLPQEKHCLLLLVLAGQGVTTLIVEETQQGVLEVLRL